MDRDLTLWTIRVADLEESLARYGLDIEDLTERDIAILQDLVASGFGEWTAVAEAAAYDLAQSKR
jgi:crotonobetainyl-CoA:carnitine CoA-transferase CaiB-like acyl-CoA transferase